MSDGSGVKCTYNFCPRHNNYLFYKYNNQHGFYGHSIWAGLEVETVSVTLLRLFSSCHLHFEWAGARIDRGAASSLLLTLVIGEMTGRCFSQENNANLRD